jgi:hypothetical protein
MVNPSIDQLEILKVLLTTLKTLTEYTEATNYSDQKKTPLDDMNIESLKPSLERAADAITVEIGSYYRALSTLPNH